MSVFRPNPDDHELISAERLFQLAFSMPREQYQQVSCLGWRREELCLALAGNILTVDCCPPFRAGFHTSGSWRRCIILPPEVTPDQIKARIIDNRLRIEVQRACP